MGGKTPWHIIVGDYRPQFSAGKVKDYIGHGWYEILNRNEVDAHSD